MSSTKEDSLEKVVIFHESLRNEEKLGEKLRKMETKNLTSKGFCEASICYNAEILVQLTKCPPGFTKPVEALKKWSNLLNDHRSLGKTEIYFSKGLFLRRAADLVISTQLKNPVTDVEIMILISAFLRLSVAYFEYNFSKIGGDLKTLTAMELLESNTLLEQYLEQYEISGDLDRLTNRNLISEFWDTLGLENPGNPPDFSDFQGKSVNLSNEFIAECTNELWNLHEEPEFLYRISWIASFEDRTWPGIHNWFNRIRIEPSSPRNVSADGTRRLSALDLEIFFLMCGAGAASTQVHPDPLFPPTISKIHSITTNQLKCWQVGIEAIKNHRQLDTVSHLFIQNIIDVARLERPPRGIRIIFRVFDYLRGWTDDYDSQMLAEKYAQRILELSTRTESPLRPDYQSLFPATEEPLDEQEKRIAHEETACFLALCDLNRGWHAQAEARVKQFTSIESRHTLLEIYTLWAEASTGQVHEEVFEKLAQLQTELYGPEAENSLICQRVTSSPIGISWKSLNTSAFLKSPHQRAMKSPTSDSSFVSATSGPSQSKNRFIGKEIFPKNQNLRITSPKSPEDERFEDAMPTLEPQIINNENRPVLPKNSVKKPQIDEKVPNSPTTSFNLAIMESAMTEFADLTFIENKQKLLKKRLLEVQEKMKKASEEAKTYSSQLSQKVETKKPQKPAEIPKTLLTTEQERKLKEIEAKMLKNRFQNPGAGFWSQSSQTQGAQNPIFPVQQPILQTNIGISPYRG